MITSPFLHTKFLVPQHGQNRLTRLRLLEMVERRLDRRLILISAPAGYGKTTLLAEFTRGSSTPSAWYQLDPADNDPAVFLAYLIETLGRVQRDDPGGNPLIGGVTQTLLGSAEENFSPQHVLTVLINELTEVLTEDTLVILEDYHLISNPTVHQLVEFLLDNAPPALHLIISTRVDPPLGLARLRARGLLAELRAEDLRFREDEVRAWMAEGSPKISEESVALLSEKTEGWAAALQIVRSSLTGATSEEALDFITNLSGSHRFIFEYLAGEVFRRQPAAHQQFLLRTAVLTQMDSVACNALPGVEQAQSVLEQLEDENLFLISLDSEGQWYRYHLLFREFLLAKLKEEDKGLYLDLRNASGAYYEAHKEYEAAFNQYLNAQAYKAAARVLGAFAPDYVERGRVEVLHRYLSALPKSVRLEHPHLLLEHGNVLRRLGEAGSAISCYEETQQVFASRGDRAGLSRALTRLAEVNRAQGNYRRAEAFAAEAQASAPDDDHAGRAEALMALAKSRGFLSDMGQGRLLAEQAVEESRRARESISRLAHANLLQSLGQICWWYGDPQATVRYCQEALQAAPEQLAPIAAKAFISMATPYLYWCELDTALEYAERGLEISQTLHLKELQPSAYTVLGNVLTRLGETARAEAALRQSMELAQAFGLASYERVMATGYLAYNLYGQGRVEEARQLAEGALWSYTGNPDTYEVFVCRSVLADVALEKGDLEEAETLFTGLLETGIRRQFNIPLAMVYFGLAYIHLVTGRTPSGISYARQAQELIEPTGAIQLYLDQGERSRVVCQALANDGYRSHFLHRVLDSLPKQPALPGVVAASGLVVTIHCLGPFQVYAGEQRISQSRWVSTKARDLLAFFVTFRGERILAARAFDAIWADKAGRGMTAFHTALSRLRKALRMDGNATKFILVEAGEYWLDTARFRVDLDDFDHALAKARAASGNDASAHWYQHAIDLYAGEFLENMYYDWVFPERRRIQQDYIGALCALAGIRAATNHDQRAADLLQKALEIDPLLENVHCQLMQIYARQDRRIEVARQYQQLQEVLAEELGVKPTQATQSLYQQLIQ